MTNKQARVLVAKGAAVLDARTPRWENVIDLDRLDLAHGGSCILGQVYGSYHESIRVLAPAHDVADDDGYAVDEWAVTHGFAALFQSERDAVELAWKELITARRGESS